MRLSGFLVPEGRRGSEVVLLDLSYEGCGVETVLDLATGDSVELSVMSRGAILAEVRWCRGRQGGAGVRAAGAEGQTLLAAAPQRTEVRGEVSMRRLGKLNYKVRVYDLSPSGCRVELVDIPVLGEKVMVKLDGLEALHCEVCWVKGRSAGLNFERVIHPAVFDLLLERLSRGG